MQALRLDVDGIQRDLAASSLGSRRHYISLNGVGRDMHPVLERNTVKPDIKDPYKNNSVMRQFFLPTKSCHIRKSLI